jgi:hypothetical protein
MTAYASGIVSSTIRVMSRHNVDGDLAAGVATPWPRVGFWWCSSTGRRGLLSGSAFFVD